MKAKFLFWHVLIGIMIAWPLRGEPVSTVPPKDYEDQVGPLLTPLEKALQEAGPPPREAEDGWIILDETIHYVREDGSRLIIEHQICRAVSQSGAESLSREVNGYRPSSQDPHLILARSIQQDGRQQTVRPEACFLQTPQREADYNLYHDNSELVIIFPNVKPGTVTEYIIATEEKKQRIPDHYVASFAFRYGWPARMIRAVSELPEKYASRLSLTPLGKDIPELQKDFVKAGRVRWSWKAEKTSPGQSEPGDAPFDQRGPLVRLNTLRDWTEFADWYRPLVERRLRLGNKLESEIMRWTKDATSPREVLQTLHAHAANDVRYVGLEFGSCDIEPHDSEEVWEHQYGDCKDKAALLVSMLRFKGIPAHLVLVNTEHLGRVERRCADWRAFNHAILVAELPEGPVFCDPTIEGSAPSVLSPSSGDRDVLVISGPERWMHTPSQSAGHYAMNLDAALSAAGELSGWATLETNGYYGVGYRNIAKTSTRQDLKARLQNLLADIWQGAKVIDIKVPETPSDQPFRIQAYFVVPPTGAQTLRFPFDASLLPDLGTGEKRLTDAFLWKEITGTKSVITLPPGLLPADVPAPLALNDTHAGGNAVWSLDGNKLRADLTFQIKTSRLPASETKGFMDTIATIRAWLDRPVTLKSGQAAEDSPMQDPADPLSTMPRMPSGEGQLTLVSQRFPLDGDLDLRRAAYEKTLEWFPGDSRSCFYAKTQIAYIEYLQENHRDAMQRLQGILAAQKGSVPVEDSALAEYTLALALHGQNKDAEALKLLESISANKDVSSFRRAWSHSQTSYILEKKEPERALKAAQAGLALQDGDEAELLKQVCLLRAQLKQVADLTADLRTYIRRESPQTLGVMRGLAAAVESLAQERPAHALCLVEAFEALQKDRYLEDAAVAASIASAGTRSKTQYALSGIRQRLGAWVKAHPNDLPVWHVPETLKTPEDFSEAIESALKRETMDHAELTRLAVESLVRFDPGPWYGERLWKSVTYIELLDRKQLTEAPPPLMITLLELCEALPTESDPHVEARFLRALMLKRRSRLQEEAAVLVELLHRPGIDNGYRLSAIERLTANAIGRQKPEDAFTAIREVKSYPKYYSTPTILLQGILLALEAGSEKTAFEFLRDLRSIEPSVIAKTRASQNVTEFLNMTRDEKDIKEWWRHSAQWWPAWQSFERQHLPSHSMNTLLIPVIPDLSEFGKEMRHMSEAGDHDGVLESVRIMGHAARWQPWMASELCALSGANLPELNKVAPAYRRLVISIHDAGGIKDPRMAGLVALWAAASHVDGGTPEAAVKITTDHLAKKTAGGEFRTAMLRLWALAAVKVGKDIDAPMHALVEQLSNPTQDPERCITVSVLASLYQRQNMRNEEIALLKQEIADPRNQKGGSTLEDLRRRLDTLMDGGGEGDGPSLAVKAWLNASKPAWYDHMPPFNLLDEKAQNPDEAMAPGTDKSLIVPEAVKLCCLIASEPGQPEERRHAAIQYLGWYSTLLSDDMTTFRNRISAIKDEKNLPRSVRAFAVWMAVRNCYWNGLHAPLQKLLAEPILDSLNDSLQNELESMRRYARAEPGDLDAADKLAAELLQSPLDYIALESLQRSIQRLARAGRIESARHHYKAMAAARYDRQTEPAKSAQQLAALKIINAAQKFKPCHDALQTWFASLPVIKALDPSPVSEPFHPNLQVDLPDPDRLRLFNQWVRKGVLPENELGFWSDVAKSLPRDDKQAASVLTMLQIVMEKAPDDEVRADMIDDSASMVDIDDPPTRARLEEVLKPWRERKQNPSMRDAFNIHDLHVKLRIGQKVDMFAALDDLRTPDRQTAAQSAILTALTSQDDKEALRRVINSIDPEKLLGRALIDDAIHAYRLLGMSDELELATDQLRHFIERELAIAWVVPRGDNATSVVHLATQIGDATMVPESFSSHMANKLSDPHEKWFFIAKDSLLRQNWKKCALAASEGIKVYETVYDYYYLLGVACHEMGHREEAIKALITYTRFDHNSREAADAAQRLAKLQTTP